jgi:hypothetical protein
MLSVSSSRWSYAEEARLEQGVGYTAKDEHDLVKKIGDSCGVYVP